MIDVSQITVNDIGDEGIDPNTIISFDSDGNPLSYYKHDSWDYSYEQGPSSINFKSWFKGIDDELSNKIKEELKFLFFSLIITPELRYREKVKSYTGYMTALRKIAGLAYRVGVSLTDAHTCPEFQIALKSSIANTLDDAENIRCKIVKKLLLDVSYLADKLNRQGKACIYIVSEKDVRDVVSLMKLKPTVRTDRTPLIPSRIYSLIINNSYKEICYAESYIDELKQFFIDYTDDPYYFVFSNLSLYNKSKSFGFTNLYPSEYKYANKHQTVLNSGLAKLFETRCTSTTYGSLIEYLSDLQKTCAIVCLLFTGMRIHELKMLPYNCLEKYSVKGFEDIICVKSRTSKMNKGTYSDELVWVSCEYAAKAIRVAQTIADCFYMHIYKTSVRPDVSKLPLWISSRNCTKHRKVHYDVPVTDLVLSVRSARFMANIKIKQVDIDELETFDMLRDWRLKIGQPWSFSSHQARRALVVYASRTGMVSLPSLGTQLKHLSLMMTALYSENSSFAKNFLEDNSGNLPATHAIVSDFRFYQAFHMSLLFHEKVISAKKRLSGGAGTAVQRYKDKTALPSLMKNEQETLKAIKEGRLSYRETIVGGCMKKGVCDRYGVDEVLPCVFDCADSVIGGDGGNKLKAYANELAWGLEDLDPNSPAYTITKKELEKIKVKLFNEEGIQL